MDSVRVALKRQAENYFIDGMMHETMLNKILVFCNLW